MSKLLAGDALKRAHARVTAEGRLGAHMSIEIGHAMKEIKRRRRVRDHQSVTDYPPKAPKGKPPTKAEVDALFGAYEQGTDTENAHDRMVQGFEMMLDSHEKQVRTRVALDAQGRPLGDRFEEPVPQGKPTEQRIAKQGGIDAFDVKVAGKGERAPVKRYQILGPLDPYSELIPPHIDVALRRFAEDAETAGITRVTANYDGASGAARGPKTGGLGNVDKTVREAYWRHQYRMHELVRRLDTSMDRVSVITILAWCVIRHTDADGAAMDLAEIGRRICPERKDARYSRGVALGAIAIIGRALVCIEHEMESTNRRINGGPGIKSLEHDRKVGRQ